MTEKIEWRIGMPGPLTMCYILDMMENVTE